MIGSRWKKVLRDLWSNKARTGLVILSIAVGVVGVGLIGQSLYVLQNGMKQAMETARFSQATLYTAPYEESVLGEVRGVPGVADVTGRTDVRARVNASEEQKPEGWSNVELFALPSYEGLGVDIVFPKEGAWPPGQDEVLLDWLSADFLKVAIGDSVWIESADGKAHKLRVAGTVQDMTHETTTLSSLSYGYISMGTLATLGMPKALNLLSFRVDGDAGDEALVQQTAGLVRQKLREEKVETLSTLIPEPGKHWAYDIVTSMGYILQTMGVLALVLGTCLVINTVFAMLGGQLRQIGVMKVLGATPGSLLTMYLGMVLLFSLIALAVGIPAGTLLARIVSNQSNVILNFDSSQLPASRSVIAVQVFVGLVVPLLSALYPVLNGIRITVREAIAGAHSGTGRRGWFDRLIERVRGLPRPFLLSLRNTFRRKGRLMLTLITLSLGGAIVVAVFSINASLHATLDKSLRYANFDVRASLLGAAPKEQLESIARSVPGVTKVESWGLRSASRVHSDGGESIDFTLAALPADSEMLEPTLLDGRWLRPGDTNAIVVDSYLLRKEPDIRVGDDIVLSLNGVKTTWHVVGLARKVVGEVVCYVNYETLAGITGEVGKASLVHAVTAGHDRAAQAEAESELKARLKENGIGVASTLITSEFRDMQEARINFVIMFLALMTTLLTAVSALGLAGSLSLNVLERTREFGILRSIGASDRSVAGIVVGEGVLNGLISCGIGSLLAMPISRYLSDAVGRSLFQARLDYSFPLSGVLFWLAGSVMLAALASLIPAWNASRLEIRNVLQYE